MNTEDYLIENYSIDNINISKPKKNGIFLLCKVNHDNNDFIIQLPKMKFNLVNDKTIELSFLKNTSKYNKETMDFLNNLDEFITKHVSVNSGEWFGENIPIESVQKMYRKSVNIDSESSSMQFKLKESKNVSGVSFVDYKNNDLVLSDISENANVDSIAQLKYLIFSKDKFHAVWDLLIVKLHKERVNRVPKFGFIEDPVDSLDSVDPAESVVKEYSFF